MIKIGGWNIRGLNDPLKQVEVSNFIQVNKLAMVGIVETHVQEANKSRIRNNICHSWSLVDNYSLDPSGRIWVGRNKEVMTVNVLHTCFQAIFLEVTTFQNQNFIVTFFYGSNDIIQRRFLWSTIRAFDGANAKPWILLGDFNYMLEGCDRITKTDVTSAQYSDFRDCVQDSHIFYLRYSGCFYTWSNKQEGDTRIASKIDRFMVNMEWLDIFAESSAKFLNLGISDHSPAIVSIFEGRYHGHPPYKFCSFWAEEPDFLEVVKNSWKDPVHGNPMMVLVKKLKRFKKVLIDWKNERFRKFSEQVETAKHQMYEVQQQLQSNPFNRDIAKQEKVDVQSYVNLTRYEESIVNEKYKVKWMAVGD
ncbi:uncharacterized protein LOC113272552 [Papaver somniferum]|uniref:uncharacterized protein LOC113272552 n=1 Tax=Papaver somniferum TaxID=3469 RepID=UPI000E705430|nr:uncharacterized protein LOC113272552 [Papaver somniferum]